MREKTISRKILVAIVAVLAAVAMMFGLSTAANATTKSGTSAGCSYYVNDDNYRTTARATACSELQACIQYQVIATGSKTLDCSKILGIPIGMQGEIQSGQVTGPVTITDNYGVFYPGRAGIGSFTISTRHS